MNPLWGHLIGVWIVLMMLVFIGVWVWAWSRHHADDLSRRIIQGAPNGKLLSKRVLPREKAKELIDQGKVDAQKFQMVTVLFADIQRVVGIGRQPF